MEPAVLVVGALTECLEGKQIWGNVGGTVCWMAKALLECELS